MIKLRKEHIPLILLVVSYISFAITKIDGFYLAFCILLMVIGGMKSLELSKEYQKTNQRPPFTVYLLIVLCLLYGVYGIRMTLGI